VTNQIYIVNFYYSYCLFEKMYQNFLEQLPHFYIKEKAFWRKKASVSISKHFLSYASNGLFKNHGGRAMVISGLTSGDFRVFDL